jgi:hypothetical protein
MMFSPHALKSVRWPRQESGFQTLIESGSDVVPWVKANVADAGAVCSVDFEFGQD